ncbi:MAG: MBL fold metallo-hydrolase [Polyangiaceae bacterium]|nr:MBL fold metallo-hydrolase [Myxococcales bacterium]MCB9587082.1 MBL fold metallo-hydrolase [Polyangiaceae bacterium]MCB9609543.1 MBL fold metallo-hydrolase [Polyangiaceae bacterium]
MRVTFHGVRGSVPAPGPNTARYGGNTSCVEVELADGSRLVLDAGTGLRELGKKMAPGPARVHLLLSHTHWDHVLGLPFFGPLWRKETEIVVYPLASEAQERFRQTVTLFDPIHFPIGLDDIPSTIDFTKPAGDVWQIGSAQVSRILLNHPGGAQGFRIVDDDGSSVCYLTDNELAAPTGAVISLDELARFAADADLLIHDSQYIKSDMPAKVGWGHSVVDDVLELGKLARPKRLSLFHHDPDRTDDALDAIGAAAETWLQEFAPECELSVASEGDTIELPPR